MTQTLLEVNNLSKKYGDFYALKDVSMKLNKGEIYGLIGRNGAGKTTFLKIISGLSDASSGSYKYFENDDTSTMLKRVGVLIEAPGIYPNLSAADHLILKAKAAGVVDMSFVDELLETVGLVDVGKKKVKNFSLGMRQRLGIAIALVGNPDLVFLDEPINGLDPQGIVEIRRLISRLAKEKQMTFIISSHILEELHKLADHFGIIHKGELLKDITKKELDDLCRNRLELSTDQPERAVTVLDSMKISQYKVKDPKTVEIYEHLEDSAEITLAMAKADVKVLGIRQIDTGLEEFYLGLTGDDSEK